MKLPIRLPIRLPSRPPHNKANNKANHNRAKKQQYDKQKKTARCLKTKQIHFIEAWNHSIYTYIYIHFAYVYTHDMLYELKPL